eukprot:scaffold22589_cov138-Cylindrotheca_fusiformis.AAC.11
MDWGDVKKQVVSVSVSRPEQQGKGRKKFTDYLVTTLFDNGAESLSRRSYEDFTWLYNRLVAESLGIIVPVLPERQPANGAEKFSEEFINDCQSVLDRFLKRIIAHPELVETTCLLKFLTSNPTEWKDVKEQQQQQLLLDKDETGSADGSLHSSNADSNSGGLYIDADAANHDPLVVSKKKPGVMGRWLAGRAERKALNNPNFVMEETPAEAKKFRDIQEYSDHLEICIQILAEDAKAISESYRLQSEKLQTMGAAFKQLWGEHELSNTSASTMYQSVGDCWGSLHKHMEGQHSFATQFLDNPLEELFLDVVALQKALRMRKKVLYDYTKKSNQQKTLQSQMDKLKSVADLSAIADRYYNLENILKSKDIEVAEAKKLKETISFRLDKDIERFRIDFHARMAEVLQYYHTAQAKYLEGQAKLLLDAVPSISKMDSGRANLPTKAVPKVPAPELKLSFSSQGTSVAIDDSKANNFMVGQVALPPEPAKASGTTTTTTTQNASAAAAPPAVPSFDDDDDHAAFGAAPMGLQDSAPPPAAAPPSPPKPANDFL